MKLSRLTSLQLSGRAEKEEEMGKQWQVGWKEPELMEGKKKQGGD